MVSQKDNLPPTGAASAGNRVARLKTELLDEIESLLVDSDEWVIDLDHHGGVIFLSDEDDSDPNAVLGLLRLNNFLHGVIRLETVPELQDRYQLGHRLSVDQVAELRDLVVQVLRGWEAPGGGGEGP